MSAPQPKAAPAGNTIQITGLRHIWCTVTAVFRHILWRMRDLSRRTFFSTALTANAPARSSQQSPEPGMANTVLRSVRKPFRWVYGLTHFTFFLTLKAAFAGLLGLFWLYQNYMHQLPDVHVLKHGNLAAITRIYNADGSEIYRLMRENRVSVAYEDIPEFVVQAFLSAEDKRFFEHDGLDYVSTARAMLQNVTRSQNNQRLIGASTITQQVAKVFFTEGEHSLDRKIREALLAREIENELSKTEIMELYLNEIFFGLNAYGVTSAASRYFGKDLSELSLSEAAFLASLPKGPTNYHPIRANEKATDRRDWVIGRMLANGFIAPAEAWGAMKEALPNDIASGYRTTAGDYTSDQVRRELLTHFEEDTVFDGGLVVQTSVDPELQKLAKRSLRNGLEAYDQRHGYRGPLKRLDLRNGNWIQQFEDFAAPRDIGDWEVAIITASYSNSARIRLQNSGRQGRIPLHALKWARPTRRDQTVGPPVYAARSVLKPGDIILVDAIRNQQTASAPLYALKQIPNVNGALVAVEPSTGLVKAIVGGYSFEQSQWNRASQAKRQPGSTFKPLVYLAALEKGYRANSRLDDKPITITFDTGEESWKPKNAGGGFSGSVPLSSALKFSKNVPTVYLAREIGMRRITEMARVFGFDPEMPEHLANVLGSHETSVLNVAGAYAMLARQGQLVIPTTIRSIRDRHGRTVFDPVTGLCRGCKPDSPFLSRIAAGLPSANPLFSDSSVRELNGILRKVITEGTARRHANRLPADVKGKTGTTNGNRDAWFAGFNDRLAVAVYVGFDTPRTLGKGEQGGSVAAPVFVDFFNAALNAMDGRDLELNDPGNSDTFTGNDAPLVARQRSGADRLR